MRCINCGTDNRYKERSNGRCKQCGRAFAFEPQRMKPFPLTDRAFQSAIEAVSERDTLYFTPRQLYYQVLRAKPARPERRRLLVGDRQDTHHAPRLPVSPLMTPASGAFGLS